MLTPVAYSRLLSFDPRASLVEELVQGKRDGDAQHEWRDEVRVVGAARDEDDNRHSHLLEATQHGSAADLARPFS